MKILITSGGCKVPIDDVRHIGNFASGRYGVDLAHSLYNKSEGRSDILFFREKGSQPFRYDDTQYVNYEDYRSNVKNIIKNWQPDIIISVAAISDYVIDKTAGKISSDNDELVIRLKKGEKIIKSFKELAPKAMVVGFKLLVSPTEEEKEKAIKKVFANGADLVIYNDLTKVRSGDATRYVYDNIERVGGFKYQCTPCPTAGHVAYLLKEHFAHHAMQQFFRI